MENKKKKGTVRRDNRHKRKKFLSQWSLGSTAATVMLIVLLLSGCGVFLLFNTTFLMDVENDDYTPNNPRRRSVTTIKTLIEEITGDQENPEGTPGETPGGGELPDIPNLDATDEELLEIFKKVAPNESKAYGLLACYKACTEQGMTSFETLGLLGCAMCEGEPGLVQYGFKLEGYGKSIQRDHPIYVNTTDKANAWSVVRYNSRGVGTAQWTDLDYGARGWSLRGQTYIDFCKKYVTDTECDYKTLWKADYDMYTFDLSGGYHGLVTDIKNHEGSLEAVVVYSMFKYEAGFGNYKNSDAIASYAGTTWYDRLNQRYDNAQAIYALFQAAGK